MNNHRNPTIDYRSDLDGLRGMGILMVLIYHGHLGLFPSAFISIDMFFVISGFLITSLILHDLNNNNFSITQFYNRRLWRLQPLFLSLLIVSVLITYLFYLPDDLLDFFRSARHASQLRSNLFFNQETSSYFSPDNDLLPLLHTWSLSIEWQFYILFALFFLLLMKHIPRKKHQLLFIGLITFVSLGLAVQSWYQNKIFYSPYYSSLGRIFEFMIGTCTALTPWKKLPLSSRQCSVVTCMGLLLFAFISLLPDIHPNQYPNQYALAACLIVALIIAAGTIHPTNLGTQFISFKLLTQVGALSYSLYVWHWLVLVILRYQNIPETYFNLVFAYAFVVLCSILSWKYIEIPCRKFHKIIPLWLSFLLLCIIPAGLITGLEYLFKSTYGLPSRFTERLTKNQQSLHHYDERYHAKKNCIVNNRKPIAPYFSSSCLVGDLDQSKVGALLIGDSFSNAYWAFMDKISRNAKIKTEAKAVPGCIVLPNFKRDYHAPNEPSLPIEKICIQFTNQVYQTLATHDYQYVILAQDWPFYISKNNLLIDQPNANERLNKKLFKQSLNQAVQMITQTHAIPVLIHSPSLPDLPKNAVQCYYQSFKRFQHHRCSTYTRSHDEQWIHHFFRQLQQQYPQLIVIDPTKIQCPNHQCGYDINGVALFKDSAGHLTDYAAYMFAKKYLNQYPNPLVSTKKTLEQHEMQRIG